MKYLYYKYKTRTDYYYYAILDWIYHFTELFLIKVDSILHSRCISCSMIPLNKSQQYRPAIHWNHEHKPASASRTAEPLNTSQPSDNTAEHKTSRPTILLNTSQPSDNTAEHKPALDQPSDNTAEHKTSHPTILFRDGYRKFFQGGGNWVHISE